MVSTHLKNISQIGKTSQIGLKMKKYLKPPPSFLMERHQRLIQSASFSNLTNISPRYTFQPPHSLQFPFNPMLLSWLKSLLFQFIRLHETRITSRARLRLGPWASYPRKETITYPTPLRRGKSSSKNALVGDIS